MRKLLFFAIGIAFALASCSSDADVTSSKIRLDEDEFMKVIKLRNYSSEQNNSSEDVNSRATTTRGTVNLFFCSFRIARPKTHCKSGFGICDFKLFPWLNSSPDPTVTMPDYQYLVQAYPVPGSNALRVEFLLDEPLPEIIEALPLTIENDLYWVRDSVTIAEIKEIIGDTEETNQILNDSVLSRPYYKIPAGKVMFNETLGDFGGYQIQLTDSI